MSETEHRRDDRYAVAMDVKLSNRTQGFRGKSVNLSLGGIGVELEGELPRPNVELRAELVFPTGGRAETQAKVVWVAGHQAGLAFSGPANSRVLAYTQLAMRHQV